MNEDLSEKSFVLYAARYYINPTCLDIEDFEEDLARFKYIKRLLTKYKESGVLKERLILNHMIVLYNLFGVYPTTRMILFKTEGNWHLIKPFLVFLNTLPEQVKIGCTFVAASDIPSDKHVEGLLKEI